MVQKRHWPKKKDIIRSGPFSWSLVMKISELSSEEKPREKLFRLGVSGLSKAELIALLVGTGSGKMDVLELSNLLLKEYGSIRNLGRASVSELCGFEGIGTAKAATLLAALELGRRAEDIPFERKSEGIGIHEELLEWSRKLAFEDREYIIALFTGPGGKVMETETLSYGGAEGAFLDTRIFLRKAVRLNAKGVGVLHNHPDGSSKPSTDDVIITDFLRRQFETLGIQFLGHFLSAGENYFEIRSSG